jgi:hypothetical protein
LDTLDRSDALRAISGMRLPSPFDVRWTKHSIGANGFLFLPSGLIALQDSFNVGDKLKAALSSSTSLIEVQVHSRGELPMSRRTGNSIRRGD